MYDIITFGSAAQDIHVKSKGLKILKDAKDFSTGEGICMALGSKIDVEDMRARIEQEPEIAFEQQY